MSDDAPQHHRHHKEHRVRRGSRYMAVAGGYMKREKGCDCHGLALPGRSTFLS